MRPSAIGSIIPFIEFYRDERGLLQYDIGTIT